MLCGGSFISSFVEAESNVLFFFSLQIFDDVFRPARPDAHLFVFASVF